MVWPADAFPADWRDRQAIDEALRDYIRESHSIISRGLSRKKRVELGLDIV
jgi:predicted DNA-binding protein (MmcQ/YjbR family)